MEQKKKLILACGVLFAEHHRKKNETMVLIIKKVLRSNFCPLEQSLIMRTIIMFKSYEQFFRHCTLAAVAAGGGSFSELKRTMLDAKVILDETGT